MTIDAQHDVSKPIVLKTQFWVVDLTLTHPITLKLKKKTRHSSEADLIMRCFGPRLDRSAPAVSSHFSSYWLGAFNALPQQMMGDEIPQQLRG